MYRAALVGLLLLAFALRLRDLGAPSLWLDELIGWSLASDSLDGLLARLPGYGGNNALYYLLLHFWVVLFGPTLPEALLRLPSVIFGVAGVGAVYAVGAALFDRRVGLAAAFLTAVNPYHIGWSQDARGYSLWVLLVTLSYLALVRAVQRNGGRRAWLHYALWTALAFFTHLFTGFVVLAQAAAVLLRARRRVLLAYAAAGLLLLVLITPLLLWVVNNTTPDLPQLSFLSMRNLRAVGDLPQIFSGGRELLAIHAGLIALGLLVTLWPRGHWRAAWRPSAVLLTWLLLPVALICGLSVTWRPVYATRYLFAIQPALCLLAGLGLARLRPTLAALGLGLAILALARNEEASVYSVRSRDDYRSAMAYLAAESAPGDGWIFIHTSNQFAWRYYAPGFGRDPSAAELIATRLLPSAPRVGFVREDLDGFAAEHPRIWLVLAHEKEGLEDTSTWIRNRLRAGGYSVQQTNFPGVRVLLYQQPS